VTKRGAGFIGVEYIRVLPEKNDPEAIKQFLKLLIEISQRLQNQEHPPSNESQEST